jgi:DNA-directed RNA polymerase specialized sigma24 family protein
MVPCHTIGEFVEKNDKEVHRIVVFVAKTYDKNVINDYVQNFYLGAIKGDLLGKYDWSRPNVETNFSNFIFRSIANSVNSSIRSDMRQINTRHISNIVDTEEATDIFEAMLFSHDTIPVSKSKDSSIRGGIKVDHTCRYSMITHDDEESFFQKLAEFEKSISEDTSISKHTKELYLSYISLASEGVSASKVAAIHDVAPAYITHVRRVLRNRFIPYWEALEAERV